MNDQILLKRFAADRSEEAFRDLVGRHLGMVLGIAERRTGNRALAQDVAQNVFAALARKAGRLTAHTSLTGWLYRSTLNECALAHRRNHTHARKMNELSERLLNENTGRDVWAETLPLLDDAIDKLPSPDREVILLRFFERKSFREIGGQLGKTESAAQKQGERALTRLSDSLRRQGAVASAAALGSGLAANALAAPSTTLIAAVADGAFQAALGTTARLTLLETLSAMNPLHLKTAAVVTAIAALPIVALPIVAQWHVNRDLRAEIAALQQRPPPVPEKIIVVKSNAAPVEVPEHVIPNQVAARPIAAAVATAAAADTWRLALFEANPVRRTQRIAGLLEALTSARAPQVAAVFDDLQKQGRRFSEEHRLFLRAWGALDGHAAMAHVAPEGFTGHNSQMMAALAGWASAQPFAAKGWIDQRPEDKSKEELIYGLLDGWSMSDFAAASAFAETRPRSPARNRFRTLLLERSLSAGGVHAAQQWVHGISDSDHNSLYKERAFDEVIQAMLYRDPSAAAQWISQLGTERYVTANAVVRTAGKLAETAPEQAMHLLQNSEHLDSRKLVSGKARVLAHWAADNPGAAGKWLQGQNNSGDYDTLAGSYARAIAKVDSATAIQWAQSIEDAGLRQQAEQGIVATLVRSGTKREDLATAGYSMEFVDEALKKPSGGGGSYGFTRAPSHGGFTGNDLMVTEVLDFGEQGRIVVRRPDGQSPANLGVGFGVQSEETKAVVYQLRAQEADSGGGVMVQPKGESSAKGQYLLLGGTGEEGN